MKAVLFALGVLGLGAIFALFEPTPASASTVTTDDVRLVSEKVTEQPPGVTCVSFNPKGKGRVSLKGPGRYPLK